MRLIGRRQVGCAGETALITASMIIEMRCIELLFVTWQISLWHRFAGFMHHRHPHPYVGFSMVILPRAGSPLARRSEQSRFQTKFWSWGSTELAGQ